MHTVNYWSIDQTNYVKPIGIPNPGNSSATQEVG